VHNLSEGATLTVFEPASPALRETLGARGALAKSPGSEPVSSCEEKVGQDCESLPNFILYQPSLLTSAAVRKQVTQVGGPIDSTVQFGAVSHCASTALYAAL